MKVADAFSRFATDPTEFVRHLLGADPREHQIEFLKAIGRGERRISMRSGRRVGKALGAAEPVLTPYGWVPIGELHVGDEVIAGDGSVTIVNGVFPQGVRTLYRVEMSDGGSVLADAEHVWWTQTRNERRRGEPGSTKTTLDIADTLVLSNGKRPYSNHRIPSHPVVQHPYAILPIHPYVLGVWLGDGSVDGRLSFGDEEIVEHLAACGQTLGTWNYDPRSTNKTAVMRGIQRSLRDLDLYGKRSYEKSIPRQYKYSAPEQRLAILQGLMDTDGTVGAKNNSISFSSVSEQLARDVQEIARSLGCMVRIATKQGKYGGKVCRMSYRLRISPPAGLPTFRLSRKLASYTPAIDSDQFKSSRNCYVRAIQEHGEGEAVCISVDHPSHLFVTKDHIVTHNTTCLAWIAMWWEMTWPDAKTIVTAPAAGQLEDAFIPELRKWIGQIKDERLRDCWEARADRFTWRPSEDADFENFITIRTARRDKPESMMGVNAPHSLVLVDEAPGVDDETMTALSGSLGGEHACLCMTGNPTRQSGYFYDTHHSMRDRWHTMHVSSVDVPTVSRDWIEEMREFYGEESDGFRVHVLGEFPTGESNVVIPLDLIDFALNNEIEVHPTTDIVWGLDVARFGNDKTALCKRQGRLVPEPIKRLSKFSSDAVIGFVLEEYETTTPSLRPHTIVVDSIGMGGPVLDVLRSQRIPAIGVNVGELSPVRKQARFFRLRDELPFLVKDWLATREVSLPKDSTLASQLSVWTYGFGPDGKIRVIDKESLRRKGISSPDSAEALAFTFYVGSAPGRKSKQVRKRNMRGIV